MKLNFVYKEIKPEGEIKSSILRNDVKEIAGIITSEENRKLSLLNIVFCNDKVIREFNKEYLGHDYETDIITFHDKDEQSNIEGELLISIDTVRSNSVRFKTEFKQELYRVIIHGILHLCGYNDGTLTEKAKMRKKENYYLNKK